MKLLDFFYESIETLHEVKVPSKQEVTKMTIAVLVIVIIAAILFAITDYIFLNLQDWVIYNFLNNLFK
jgi:preprotein translocase SecE subunit